MEKHVCRVEDVRFQAQITPNTFLPFIWGPQHFSKHFQLAELSSQLAEPALLVKLREKTQEERDG